MHFVMVTVIKKYLPLIIGLILLIIIVVLTVMGVQQGRAFYKRYNDLKKYAKQLEEEKITSINNAIIVYQDSIKVLHQGDMIRSKTIDSLLVAVKHKEKQIIIKNNEIDNMYSYGLVNELSSIFATNGIK